MLYFSKFVPFNPFELAVFSILSSYFEYLQGETRPTWMNRVLPNGCWFAVGVGLSSIVNFQTASSQSGTSGREDLVVHPASKQHFQSLFFEHLDNETLALCVLN